MNNEGTMGKMLTIEQFNSNKDTFSFLNIEQKIQVWEGRKMEGNQRKTRNKVDLRMNTLWDSLGSENKEKPTKPSF